MNCPSCSGPVLFGSTVCACGRDVSIRDGETDSLEISYWEALRAYWRVYWPTQLLGMLVAVLAQSALTLHRTLRNAAGRVPAIPPAAIAIFAALLLIGSSAVLLLVFVPRIVSRPYRGFSLLAVTNSSGETNRRLSFRMRGQVWFFLWWRQMAAGLLLIVLLAPLNALLSIMGVQIQTQIGVLAGLFAVGPILVKMLIGHPFASFHIEATRPAPPNTATRPAG